MQEKKKAGKIGKFIKSPFVIIVAMILGILTGLYFKEVLLAGLDLDYKSRPFGPMPLLISKADHVIKLHSVCTFCSAPAKYTHRISEDSGTVLLGEKDKYVPLCRSCYKELT